MKEAQEFWARPLKSLESAKCLLGSDPDSPASRAYYAAFYAVSGLFAAQGKTFFKHSGVEATVHRDLVAAGLWSNDLGRTHSSLLELRATGGYGVMGHVSPTSADWAVGAARDILLRFTGLIL